MTLIDYIISILPENEAKKLILVLKQGKTIIITGSPQPTGKTTLCKVLNTYGYQAVEGYLTHEVTLNDPLPNLIPNFVDEVDVKGGDAVEN